MITQEHLTRMLHAGISVISSGANVPFADPEIFFGPIAEEADNKLSLLPDFIANCGMARVFAYLMSYDIETIEDERKMRAICFFILKPCLLFYPIEKALDMKSVH